MLALDQIEGGTENMWAFIIYHAQDEEQMF